MRKSLPILLFSAVALLPLTTSAADKLIIGVDNWPPFRFVTNEEISGIDHELWSRLSRRLDFEIEFFRCPWKRCLRMMEKGQIDAMSGLAWRKERAEYITYIQPHYYTCSTQLYLRHGYSRRISKHRDLHTMTVGMVGGSAYYEAFDKDKDILKINVAQEAVLPNLLLEERIDAFIGTDCQADYELQSRGISHQIDKAVFKPGNSVKLYVGLSSASKWTERINEFNQALQHLEQEQFSVKALDLITSSPKN
ncbi:ABC transporter substrate-binding protein [Neptuniibacter sp.]|uniref:substrate-binding periplasmic protein n=1 Tax=Neptuniibacter sp. TaxID=1962643 RepID=UPI00262050BA|nr:transporter substrate-binding domain-containing protein [Neptuniibacter sp.]MCP4597514.1 amino acid ABC transporter substrate-binding protein [Neptuniibacter sp.]